MAVAEHEIAENAQPRPMRWTRSQYFALADMGMFLGKRVERIEGEIIEMPPMGRPHRTSVLLVSQALQSAFGNNYFSAPQVPLEIGEFSDPEPDVAIYMGSIRDYTNAPLASAVLVVEISASTLSFDRTGKAALYARAGMSDYWIVNLEARQVEVYRQPGLLPEGLVGYGEVTIYQPGQSISPLAAPNASVMVADLLP